MKKILSFCVAFSLALFTILGVPSLFAFDNMITNKQLQNYQFLQGMSRDTYYPKFLVDKGTRILVDLCLQIEKQQPDNIASVYKLTHAATEEFNALAVEFENHDSEIETMAREIIGMDFNVILSAYGYKFDLEEAISPRDW